MPTVEGNLGDNQYHLVYFLGIGGRAEPIRLLLRLAEVEFQDEMFSLEEFGDPNSEYHTRKAAGKFSPASVSGAGLPVLKVGEKVLFETNAIMRYLGAKHGFYSSDPEVMWEIDACLCMVETILAHAGIAQHSHHCLGNIQASSGGDGPTEEVDNNCFAMYEKLCDFADRQLSSHGKKFLAGTDSVTCADLRHIVQFSDSIYNEESSVLGSEMRARVKAVIDAKPALKAWIEDTMLPLIKGKSSPGLMW